MQVGAELLQFSVIPSVLGGSACDGGGCHSYFRHQGVRDVAESIGLPIILANFAFLAIVICEFSFALLIFEQRFSGEER